MQFRQCEDLGIPVLATMPGDGHYDLVIDAIFGFSFKGEAREPFKSIIELMAKAETPVLSVDVPSGEQSPIRGIGSALLIWSDVGWHVSNGDVYGTGFIPAAVISLTLPKVQT